MHTGMLEGLTVMGVSYNHAEKLNKESVEFNSQYSAGCTRAESYFRDALFP